VNNNLANFAILAEVVRPSKLLFGRARRGQSYNVDEVSLDYPVVVKMAPINLRAMGGARRGAADGGLLLLLLES
jgi:hypothetical protein